MINSQIDSAIWSRISDDSGETIAETLVSVLISALALLLMATAIGTSVNMVISTRNHMDEYYKSEAEMIDNAGGGGSANVTANTVDGSGSTAVVPIWRNGGSADTNSVSVQVWSSAEDGITLYKMDLSGGVP